MELSLWSIFIVNVTINSLMAFFTLSVLVIVALKILNIRNPRLRAFCLCIPFVKLVFDLGFYQFSHWALAQQINPLTSPEGSRILSAVFWLPSTTFSYPLCSISLQLEQGQTFTFADLLCLQMGNHLTLTLALIVLVGCAWSLGRAIWQFHLSYQQLEKMRLAAALYSHPIQDFFLSLKIQRKKVSIYLTEIAHSPFIASHQRPSIFISRALFEKLSSQEFEAIIAHEMAHLQNGDLFLNTTLFWICSLFWWIPTNYFKKQLELAQEYACDRLLHTQLHRLHLAEALYKSANWLHASPLPSLSQPLATSHHAVKRLQALVKPSTKKEPHIFKWLKVCILMIWIITLCLSKFWSF